LIVVVSAIATIPVIAVITPATSIGARRAIFALLLGLGRRRDEFGLFLRDHLLDLLPRATVIGA
jgi:hypothetical protein